MTEARSVRLGVAAIAGASAAAGLYAILRVVQSLLFSEADPALILWSEHAGYFWRAWTAVYVGGMVSFLTYVAATRNATRTLGVVAKAVVVAATLAILQGVLVP